MPPVDSSCSSPPLTPGTAEAFHRAVREACGVVRGSPIASATLAGARVAEPSRVRLVAPDPDSRLTYPVLRTCLDAVTLSGQGCEAACAVRQAPEAPKEVDAPKEVEYCTWVARQMHLDAMARTRKAPGVPGLAVKDLKPGMCRLVSARSLLEGIEFGELRGDLFDTYEFVLRFPVHKRHLCLWATLRSGAVNLRLECGDSGRTVHSNRLDADDCQSQGFRFEWESRTDCRTRLAIAKIEGARTCFVGLRLYLMAV